MVNNPIGQWIDVGERMPEQHVPVLAYMHAKRRIGIGFYYDREDGRFWGFNGTCGHESVYPEGKWDAWMPLPEPPLSATPSKTKDL